ncbi:MAG: hypothetical protein OWU32_07930 [Firmicutes bacterium]|nr:hypothetical protein [Bacillota bacterium]
MVSSERSPFMDVRTQEQIGFHTWSRGLRLSTVYGRLRWAQRQPYLPGEEARWREDEQDRVALSFMWPQLVTRLQKLPDVTECEALLEAGETLTLTQMALLRRHACLIVAIDEALAQEGVSLSFWRGGAVAAPVVLELPDLPHAADRAPDITSTGPWGMGAEARALAAVLGLVDATAGDQWEQVVGFSLLDVAPAVGPAGAQWLAAQARLAPLSAARVGAQRAFADGLGRDYRTALRRDQTLILSLDSPLVASARRDSRLRRRAETPFEIVFDPVWPAQIDDLSEQEATAREQLAVLERHLLAAVSRTLWPMAAALHRLNASVACLDLVVARLAFAGEVGGSWTHLGRSVHLDQGTHPDVVGCVPLDIDLQGRVTVLTGPNMGGKSVAQKTLLLAQACHQFGLPIPGANARLAAPLFGALRYVGGDGQSLASSLSSFGAEVLRIQEALTLERPLLCLDEPGRTTNPNEGSALVRALIEHLRDLGPVAEAVGETVNETVNETANETATAGAPEVAPALASGCATALVATHFTVIVPGVAYLRVRGIDLDSALWPQGLGAEERLVWLSQRMDYSLEPLQLHSGLDSEHPRELIREPREPREHPEPPAPPAPPSTAPPSPGQPPAQGLAIAAWLGLEPDVIERARALAKGVSTDDESTLPR